MTLPRNSPFEDRYEVDAETGCWNWRAGRTKTGYGVIQVGGRQTTAHRVSYERSVGPIPTGLHLDHLCRNRSCVNPEHLEPVTNAENIQRGSNAKVTADDVREIRRLAAIRPWPRRFVTSLAESYGICERAMRRIITGERWGNVA